MNREQRIHMMAELWPNACTAQGWAKGDDEKRYDLFARVLGHKPRHKAKLDHGDHISFNSFDEQDFTDVKKELLLFANRLPKPAPANKKTQTLWVIQNRIMPCIALYRPADVYVKTILKTRFKKVPGVATMADLSDVVAPGQRFSPLQQFLFTLSRALDRLRAEAGHTGHEMHQLASLACKPGCARCRPVLSEGRVSGVPNTLSVAPTITAPDPEYVTPEGQPF